MGNHRAPRSRPAPPRWLTAMLALTVVFVVVVVAIKLGVGSSPESGADSSAGPGSGTTGSGGATGAPSPGDSAGTPTTSPSTAPSSSPSPSPRAKATPRPGSDLARLAPSTARRLLAGDLVDAGFDFAVAPLDGRLAPSSSDEVSRWDARGLPGNPADDTVVIVGSTAPSAALARLDRLRRGDPISLVTDNGRVTYTVDSIGTVPSADGASAPAVRARVPGRLVLLGARFDGAGDRAARDLLVVATISAVRPG